MSRSGPRGGISRSRRGEARRLVIPPARNFPYPGREDFADAAACIPYVGGMNEVIANLSIALLGRFPTTVVLALMWVGLGCLAIVGGLGEL